MSAAPERPVPPSLPTVDQVPEELRSLRRWVGWRAVWDENKEKWRKPPHSPLTGEGIGAVEKWSDHWVDFARALEGVQKHHLDGVGFVFKDGDGFIGVDFDDCRQDGKNHSVVDSWLKWMPTYCEVSPSGTGVHAIGKAKIAKSHTATALPDAGDSKVEVYNQGRYFTFTGQRISKVIKVEDIQAGVDKLLHYLGGKEIGSAVGNEQQRPMSKLTARRIHKDNLIELRNALEGQGNALLNTSAFFAGRAFAAGALDKTEDELKAELFRVVTEEWSSPHPAHGARQTIDSGWSTGIEKPLQIMDDAFPELTELVEDFNRQFYVVEDFGNKCRVCWEDVNPHMQGKSIVLGNSSFHDFRNRFSHEKIVAGSKLVADVPTDTMKDKGTAWLEHRHRNQYKAVVFLPAVVTSSKVRNLWRGFAYDPKKGNCQRYLEHVAENICQGDKDKYKYALGWMAYAVRNPGEPGHVAIVVQGQKGVGKNVFAEGFATLWGSHSLVISSENGITGNFNSHLRDKIVIVADEAFFAGDPRQDRVLKSMVTGNELLIEAKGVDRISCPNFLHFIIIGNDDRLVNATDDERRYFAVRCGNKHKDDHRYFATINRELNNGGYAALLYHLMFEVDLMSFNVRNAPRTPELTSQIADSLRGFEAAWFYCLVTGQIPGRPQKNGTIHVKAVELVDWAGNLKNSSQRWGKITPQQVGLTLTNNPRGEHRGFGFDKDQPMFKGERSRIKVIPTLTECRKLWDEYRFHYDWPKDDGQWDTIDMDA